MLRVGILGMGGMGWFHTTRYMKIPGVKLVAIADIVPERLDIKNKVQMNIDAGELSLDTSSLECYSHASLLIQQAKVDYVDICLPTDLHADYAIQAMQAGLHVLCEKPMSLTLGDADRMLQTAKETQRTLMIAQVIRFWPEYIYLRDRISDQQFGELRSLNMWRMGARPGWSPDNWFLDPKRSGGVILDLHIHDVDFVNSVFGSPDTLIASGRQSAVAKSYDVIHAIFGYKLGAQVHMHAGWSPAGIPFQAGFEAWFDKALIRFSEGKLEVYTQDDQACLTPEIPDGDGYLNEIAYFLDCVQYGKKPELCMPESTRDSMLLIERELAYMRG